MTSDLEDTLAFQLDAYEIHYLRQVKFHPTRKWLADFAIEHNGHRLIVECNGGTWKAQTGHTSGQGIIRDYDKGNHAQLLGWTYLQFTAQAITSGAAIDMIIKALEEK